MNGASSNGAGSRGTSPAPHRVLTGNSSGTVSGGEVAHLSVPSGKNRHHVGTVEEDEVDAWALAQSGGAGSSLIVRFEIFVVKVSRDRCFSEMVRIEC